MNGRGPPRRLVASPWRSGRTRRPRARAPWLEFARIEAGRFTMGADLAPGHITAERGIFIQDEFPTRPVRLTYPFGMSRYEITNAQYEAYDPTHAAWRGRARGLSREDREPVVYVGWKDAVGFCRWLSAQDPGHDYHINGICTDGKWARLAMCRSARARTTARPGPSRPSSSRTQTPCIWRPTATSRRGRHRRFGWRLPDLRNDAEERLG